MSVRKGGSGAPGKLSRIVPGDADVGAERPEEEALGGGSAAAAWSEGSTAASRGLGPACEQWIQKERLLAHLAHQRESIFRIASLPLVLLGFVGLAALFVGHLRLSTVHGLTSAAKQHLQTAGAGDLGFPDSAWAWLRNGSGVPLMAPHMPVVAGVRLSRVPDGWSGGPWVLCGYSVWSYFWDAIGAGGMPSELRSPSVCHDKTPDTAWLPWVLRQDSTDAAVDSARGAWHGAPAGAALGGLQISLLAHDTASNFYVLGSLTLRLDPSGLPVNETRVAALDAESVWLSASGDWEKGRWPLQILDIAFLGMAVGILLVRLVGLCLACRAGGCRTCRHVQFGIWELVDLTIVCASLPTVVLYAYCCDLTVALTGLVRSLPAFGHQQRLTRAELDVALASVGTSWNGYTLRTDVVLDQAERLAAARFGLVCCAAVLASGSWLRLCMALQASPRLGMFLSALRASKELVYPVVAFAALVAALSLTGHVIYGGRVGTFSGIGDALGSTLLLLVGRAFDPVRGGIRDAGGALGTAWLWLLGAAASLLLLAWVLAVVVDGHLGAKARAAGPQSLLGQARRALMPARQRAQDLRALADALGPRAGDRPERAGHLAAVREAARDFGGEKLLAQLSREGVHPASVVSPASLAHALGAETWAARLQLEAVIRGALEWDRSGRTDGPGSLEHALRLMARVEVNVRDLGDGVRPAVGYVERVRGEEPWTGVEGDPYRDDPLAAARSGASTPTSCTDDFECEDLEPPPPPPPEEEDEDEDLTARGWTVDLEEVFAPASAGTPGQPPAPWAGLGPPTSRAASPNTNSAGVRELLLPPSTPVDTEAGPRPVADRLEALELAGARRCAKLREYCANLECSLASAAERMEATVGTQVDALSKLESSFDQIIRGMGPLFAPL